MPSIEAGRPSSQAICSVAVADHSIIRSWSSLPNPINYLVPGSLEFRLEFLAKNLRILVPVSNVFSLFGRFSLFSPCPAYFGLHTCPRQNGFPPQIWGIYTLVYQYIFIGCPWCSSQRYTLAHSNQEDLFNDIKKKSNGNNRGSNILNPHQP